MTRAIAFPLICVVLIWACACSDTTGAEDMDSVEPIGDGGNTSTFTVAHALSANKADHEDEGDYIWDNADVISIELEGDQIVANSDHVHVEGSTVTILSAGTYDISGSLSDGQVVVDTDDEDIVRLILKGVDITNSTSAAITILSAEKTVIILADGTVNKLTDRATYSGAADADATLFSKDDLSIFGNGSLTIQGNYNDGIACNDGLVINSGYLTVRAADDGIRGKDYVVVRGGQVFVDAAEDGFKSDNDTDETEGYILVEGGNIDVIAGGDALQAQTDALIAGGEIVVVTGGGSSAYISDDLSAKGIKAGVSLVADSGTIHVDA